MSRAMPLFSVIPGETINTLIQQHRGRIVDIVRAAYLDHELGQTINPDSYFLRFEDNPSSRIIALPAALTGDTRLSGIKWIASYPENIQHNLPRASATLILNQYDTGYPYACLEASLISAARTAASAALAANVLGPDSRHARKIAVIGAGIIARNILEFLIDQDWRTDELAVFDLNPQDAARLAAHGQKLGGYRGVVAASLQEALDDADLVVLATTVATPYITQPDAFKAGQLVLNISLRDIAPELVMAANNVVDDIEHCMKANTSPHLAEQKYQTRSFVNGTLAQVITGEATLDHNKPTLFSPFGLGVLDLAVGHFVYEQATANGQAQQIPNFFAETQRWAHEETANA
ncbi:Delta(1)-pyrroline-2-carboxylate reductase [Andreprevotia sp. IGB-42]|uniref:2,3-diaminopropionate biosynthesis protein SbnB n=1 Tax=Andreprevotia sp. IGB-42 TaxID=2497473 RepID=UPI00157F3BE0|nr:2,3-diaminopropionate biosynthesis protein SbnB [Andreprevotia sp. IGB-42]KAF0813907.1 Delta(1)-pyrroline-2-carboxylate reductase [Andreprevotia sp. IGB-42]